MHPIVFLWKRGNCAAPGAQGQHPAAFTAFLHPQANVDTRLPCDVIEEEVGFFFLLLLLQSLPPE